MKLLRHTVLLHVITFAVVVSVLEADRAPARQVPEVKFGPAYFLSFYSYPASIAVGDLNNDGNPDLMVGDHYSNEVYVLLGNGDGTFQEPVTYYLGGSGVLSSAIGDLNGDGIPDLAAASPCPATGSCTDEEGVVSVLLGNGDGTFRAAVSYSPNSYGGWATSGRKVQCAPCL